jgi:hypothetical protein
MVACERSAVLVSSGAALSRSLGIKPIGAWVTFLAARFRSPGGLSAAPPWFHQPGGVAVFTRR